MVDGLKAAIEASIASAGFRSVRRPGILALPAGASAFGETEVEFRTVRRDRQCR